MELSVSSNTWNAEVTMSIVADFVKALEQSILEIKEKHIKPLKSGMMSIKKGPPGRTTDVTKEEKKSLEANIRTIEAVLKQYRSKVS
jgi:hypothetical protein